jgi:hypothetical protein
MPLLTCLNPKQHAPQNADTKKQRRHQKKHEQKQVRAQEKQQQQDFQRQKNPNGLLEIALTSGWRRESFTAADPGTFYKGHQHENDAGNDPWKDGGARKDGMEG